MKTKKQKTLAELKKDLELISKKELTQIVGGKKEKPKKRQEGGHQMGKRTTSWSDRVIPII